MRKLTAVLIVLLSPSLVWADPPTLNIPLLVPAIPGQWVVVSPDTTAKSVIYVGLDGLSAFPSSELKDPRKLIVAAPVNVPAGTRYRFVAVGTLNDEQTQTPFSIIVGDAPPTPVPPTPVPPTPPGPVSELSKLLQAAFLMEAAGDKEKVSTLASVMRFAALWADDPTITSNAILVAKIKKETNDRIVTALPNTRVAIGKYLNAILPMDEVALTPEVRAKYKAAYTEIAKALENIR